MHARQQSDSSIICFATTVTGLESLAADELETRLEADIRKKAPGLVIFRVNELTPKLLRLRMVEDVFLLAWGTDSLTYRAADLKQITHWTAKEARWPRLLQAHHQVHPKPKGKPTYHLVCQMHGKHGYRRLDALKALSRGLEGKFPSSWQPREENAAVEVWLIIHGKQALCGLRLSDKRMRHRTYKQAHMPASLRPVVAAAMVQMAKLHPDEWLIDPLCGVGTILAERLSVNHHSSVLGGDADRSALYAAYTNLRSLTDEPPLVRWDATELPLADQSIPCIVTNLPFGRQIGSTEEIADFYDELLDEFDRVLTDQGRAILLVDDAEALSQCAFAHGWQQLDQLRIRLLGHDCYIMAWRKN